MFAVFPSQGRGSKAQRKNVVLFKPSAVDTWTDGVRSIKFLFSRPSAQNPMNSVYLEDVEQIVKTFGHDALKGLQIKQDASKTDELAAVAEAAKKKDTVPMEITDPQGRLSVGPGARSCERPGPY